MSKKSNNGRKTSTVYSLLKATLPWRWTDAIMISARNIGTTTAAWPRRVLWVRSYARQASTKRRESNGSDVQWRWAHQGTPPNAPRLGFCWIIEQRSLLHFYFTNSGWGSSFRMSSVFVLCNLLQKWVCYACPKFWKFLPECTVVAQTTQPVQKNRLRDEADSFEPAEWSERLTPGQSGWLGAAAVGSIPALALSLFLQRLNFLLFLPWTHSKLFLPFHIPFPPLTLHALLSHLLTPTILFSHEPHAFHSTFTHSHSNVTLKTSHSILTLKFYTTLA